MKKLLTLFIGCSLLFMSCRHDDFSDENNQEETTKALQGKSFVLTQEQLQAKYAGNKNLNTILQNEFKVDDGLIKTNSDGEGNGVYIDLEQIRVFESDQMHTITYYVEIGEQESEEPKELYNLMYFSKDYENYHVILFRYDFNQISFQQYIANPEQILNVLGFIPLNDIENIYENIKYSVSQGLIKTSSTSPTTQKQFLEFANCIEVTIIPEQPCGGRE